MPAARAGGCSGGGARGAEPTTFQSGIEEYAEACGGIGRGYLTPCASAAGACGAAARPTAESTRAAAPRQRPGQQQARVRPHCYLPRLRSASITRVRQTAPYKSIVPEPAKRPSPPPTPAAVIAITRQSAGGVATSLTRKRGTPPPIPQDIAPTSQ